MAFCLPGGLFQLSPLTIHVPSLSLLSLQTFVCPREVIWLNGAPGSGKGTNINWIMKSRGLSRAIGMSQLLDSSPEIRAIIDKAELVPDDLVLDALLDAGEGKHKQHFYFIFISILVSLFHSDSIAGFLKRPEHSL